jgi:UDPglucose--hexose-1-phosphate uridylyltransferase
VIAPGRARRPGAERPAAEPPTAAELDACPFCEGREERTPPETLALPEREPPDSPGWRVRVVPNLYPAFERQEVVVHSREHKRSFTAIADEEVSLVAEAWRRRRAAHPRGYLHALMNEGRAAGASLAHSHSQLVWFAEPPPAVRDERAALDELIADVQRKRWNDLEVELDQDVLAFCAPAGRTPYEVVIANAYTRGEDVFAGDTLARALLVLRSVVRRLHAVEGAVAWNAWLHTQPEWHIELVPRTAVFAGIELGAGIYVNTLAPEVAAERLREPA